MRLQKIEDSLKFADYVMVEEQSDGNTIFVFMDRSQHVHGSYQKNNSLSCAPPAAIGAVKQGNDWFWLLESNKVERPVAESDINLTDVARALRAHQDRVCCYTNTGLNFEILDVVELVKDDGLLIQVRLVSSSLRLLEER